MPTSPLSLPPELQLTVFANLDDLDDALYLSRCCTDLRNLYETHKRTIHRQIICSSSVYEYDFTLSQYTKPTADLGLTYLKSGKTPPDAVRPKESAIVNCTKAKWTRATATDEVIRDIASRWGQERYLRELYQDPIVFQEFELFRERFVIRQSARVHVKMVKPELIRFGIDLPRETKRPRLGPDFKARFHKSLCLHSMAISSRRLGLAAVNEVVTLLEHPNDLADATVDDIMNLWSKHSVVISGKRITLTLAIKLDCLEVFDFLYLFLLRKAIPGKDLDSWTEQDLDDWPFERYFGREDDGENEIHRDAWYNLLYHARYALQPSDLTDLLLHRATNDYPTNKHKYMLERGAFDFGCGHDMDWYSRFERWAIVSGLFRDEPSNIGCLNTHDTPCWWDHIRLRWGSPFQSKPRSRYLSELSEYTPCALMDESELDCVRPEAYGARLEMEYGTPL